MRQKLCIIFVFLLISSAFRLHSLWQMDITIQNHSASEDQLETILRIGEHEDATEAYDYYYDLPYLIPPMNPSYIVAYFPHSDWGEHSGNYIKDIRSTQIFEKAFDATLRAQNPYSSSYSISWQLPPEFPDYYQPRLLRGGSEIDMRQQDTFTFHNSGSYSYFSIELSPDADIPVELQPIGTLHFSDNQLRRINLDRHFRAIEGSLSYATIANVNLHQALSIEADSTWWELYPLPGWIGQTTVELNVQTDASEISREISVIRDSTNSPPQWLGPQSITIQQNGSFSLALEGLIFDPDRDEVNLTLEPEMDLVSILDDGQSVELTPNEGFKGEILVQVFLDDGSNPIAQANILLRVEPVAPAAPQNLHLGMMQNGLLRLSWDPVDSDPAGGILPGISYNVYHKADPEAEFELRDQDLTQNFLDMDPAASRMFFKVIVINE